MNNSLAMTKRLWKMNEFEEYLTYIPNFCGFYETIFSFDIDDYELEYIAEKYGLNKLNSNFIDILYTQCVDYDRYREGVGREYLDFWLQKVKEFDSGFDAEFDGIRSPREYNFSTDKIDIILKAKSESIQKLYDFCINKKREHFGQYLKENFSSYDGFYSFWPNNWTDWIIKFRSDYATASELGFMIVYMLDFVLDEMYEGLETVHDDLKYEVFERINSNKYINYRMFEKLTGLIPIDD